MHVKSHTSRNVAVQEDTKKKLKHFANILKAFVPKPNIFWFFKRELGF